MNQPEILYAAIFVFSMLLIGLMLTIREFYRLQSSASKPGQQNQASVRGNESTDTRFSKASGF